MKVEAALFSTSTGQLIAYDESELETEWSRLRTLPPGQILSVGRRSAEPSNLSYFVGSTESRPTLQE